MTPFYRELLNFGWLFAFLLAMVVLPWVAHEIRLWWSVKRTTKVLLTFLDNARFDLWNHIRHPRDSWEVAESCVWLEETFTAARKAGWKPPTKKDGE